MKAKNTSIRLVVPVLAALLPGCVGAPARRPDAVDIVPPVQWTASETPDGRIEDGWWTRFGDSGLDRVVRGREDESP